MRFAEKLGERILPNPLEKNAICPLCKSQVISKCGEIKVWHWAHKTSEDCDNWGGRETDWHLNWKAEFPEEMQEVTIGKHRADVRIKDIVLEFQSSPISSEDIKEREEFYGKMKWVLDGKKFAENRLFREKKGFLTFRWKWAHKSWVDCSCPLYFDLGISTFGDGMLSHKLFLVRKIYWDGRVGGWGKIVSKETFMEECHHGYYRN